MRSHLLENQTVNNERLVVEVIQLFQCYLIFIFLLKLILKGVVYSCATFINYFY